MTVIDRACPALEKADLVLPRLFRRTAGTHPDRPAVCDTTGWTSYQELADHAHTVGRVLRDRGLGPGRRLAVAARRGVPLYTLMLGALEQGAVLLPLNAHHPPEHLAAILTAGDPALLVDDGSLPDLDRTDASTMARVDLDGLLAEAAALPDGPRDETPDGPHAEDTAQVMFTSGTTGQPKGVEIAHRGLARLAVDGATLGIDETDGFAQLSEVSFAASTNEIWLALLHGARLVVLPERWPSIAAIRRAVRDQGVTVLSLPAGLFGLIVDEEPELLDRLRAVFVSGDFPSPRHLAAASQHAARVFNGYGCTENSSISALWPVDPARVPEDGPMPVGRPLPSVTMDIRDAAMRPCGAGEIGELCIGGAGVARGYLDDPVLTARRFVTPPGHTDRFFRTGDLARTTPDGDIVLVGREDGLVKIRGFRVELAAVETALRDLPGVAGGAVVAAGDPGRRSLAAFYVPRAGTDLTAGAVRASLARRLPDYMVPAALTALEVMPTNTNGKVDRSMLAELASTDTTNEEETMETPRDNALENVILEMWKSLIKIDDVDVESTFLAQGATSLQFVQFSSNLEKVLGVEVSPEDVFRHGNVQGLARHVAERRSAGVTGPA